MSHRKSDLQILDSKIAPPLFDWPGSSSARRPRRRIMGDSRETHFYHLMTRSNDIIWDDVEKEGLRKILFSAARFAKIEILTYCLMGNHWHALVKVSPLESVRSPFLGPNGEQNLFEHLKEFYSKAYLKGLQNHLYHLSQTEQEEERAEIIDSFITRIGDLPWFVKSVKERFSKWYNKRHDRAGTHWRERYKSVLVEDGEALRTMSAYIDLNPVRAGLVEDPKDYRWSGYGEAVAGNRDAQLGLSMVFGKARNSWTQSSVALSYRQFLFIQGRERLKEDHLGKRSVQKTGISSEVYQREMGEKAGDLTRSELLRCEIKYFTQGVAIGSKAFVDKIFQNHRDQFGPGRKVGAKPLQGDWKNLHTLRSPQEPVVKPWFKNASPARHRY